jgi:hypothetical protein
LQMTCQRVDQLVELSKAELFFLGNDCSFLPLPRCRVFQDFRGVKAY